MPPVARTTARACTAPTPSSVPSPSTCRVMPAARPSAVRSRSSTSACSTTRIAGDDRTAATSARCTSAPVASPPACTIRSRWWPPSRVSDSSPDGSRSNAAPSATSSRSRAGPSVHSTRTASTSQSPTPATSVSCRWSSGLSSGDSAAATPPCAQRVEPSSTSTLVTSRTLPDAGGVQRDGQPGDAGADDDHVGRRRPAGLRGEQALGLEHGGGDHPTSVVSTTSPRRRPVPGSASAGSLPRPTTRLSASTKTTFGACVRASASSMTP